MKKFSIFFLACGLLAMTGCTSNDNHTPDTSGDPGSNVPSASVPALSYSVAAAYPHDTSSFTEGLEFYNGQLLESTGNYGKSKLLHLDLKTGKPERSVSLPEKLFGEGLTVVNDTLYQLTWKEKTVLVYSAKDFKKVKELPLNTEGWGLTHDGKSIIASDGTSNLYFYEPGTFRLLRTQGVTENGSPAININELEYIDGYVYANQWMYNYIIKIDPNSGQVVAKMDLSDLVNRVKAKNPDALELNGIAYNPETKKVYVTGKLWQELYEIQFQH
ncbi:glutaminyl-peptide cyclotransferase [Paraflavisolibacter sp. H34]|uniref:glutaminyl-peptide cyclotransferase n=1 Tax=Huijunlia imazamoxiresistens TaxID=3127457 RepID=UPI0030160C53